MQLVLVAHGRRAALEVADGAALVGHDEGPLELPGARGVDAEIRRELHGTAHALRDIAERAVAEDRRVERREEVVRVWHHGAQVALDEGGVLLDRLREGAEDDAELGQLLLEGGAHGDAVEDRIDSHASEALLLLERNAQPLEGAQDLRVDLIEARRGPPLGRRVVDDLLVVDGRVRNVRPPGLRRRALQGDPVPVGPEPPIEHELGLVLLGRNRPDDVLVQSGRQRLRLDRRDEPIGIGSLRELLNLLGRPTRPLLPRHSLPPPSRWRPFWSHLSLTQGFYLSNWKNGWVWLSRRIAPRPTRPERGFF